MSKKIRDIHVGIAWSNPFASMPVADILSSAKFVLIQSGHRRPLEVRMNAKTLALMAFNENNADLAGQDAKVRDLLAAADLCCGPVTDLSIPDGLVLIIPPVGQTVKLHVL